MKLRRIVGFEIAYQLRRRSTWLYFAIVLGLTIAVATQPFLEGARRGGYFFNGPFVIAAVTVLAGIVALLVTAAVAGDAATRDMQTRIEPLLYSTPVSKATYLGGRFLGAFGVSALLLAAVQLVLAIIAYLPGLEANVAGPLRPAMYLTSYVMLALPSAFAATALLFSMAVLSRRALASYVGAALLLLTTLLSRGFIAKRLGQWALAKQIDPLGLTFLSELSRAWTPLQKSTVPIGFQSALVTNRLLWLAVACGVLAFTHLRFRFAHHTPRAWRPFVTLGPATRVRQTLTIAMRSLREIATSWTAIVLAAGALALVVTAPEMMQHLGIPLLPTTGRMTSVLARSGDLFWIIIPLLTVVYAGELVWRERDARMNDLADVTPVPDWVPFVGKLIALGLMLALFQALVTVAGVVAQLHAGYYDFELGAYVRILFGLQLVDYLLFAVLALAIHVLVNQKYVGHLVLLLVSAFPAFAPGLGIGNNLFVYGSDPGWRYSQMSGFDPYVGPFLWFKLYWAGWTLLLAMLAKLWWVRGTERGPRFTRALAAGLFAAVVVVLFAGAFITFNTDTRDLAQFHADNTPQPRLTETSLRVEIDPLRREVQIHGTYRMVNDQQAAIKVIRVTTASNAETKALTMDRGFTSDATSGMYTLKQPLQPGESLRLNFTVHYKRKLFSNDAVSMVRNGTQVEQEWLPAIGDNWTSERTSFDAVVATEADQLAIAPGALRRTWSEKGRRYVHYVTDAPIRNSYAIYSARYAVREARWRDVQIQIFHHPGHARDLDQFVKSIQASLTEYTAQFGPYPHHQLRLIETSDAGIGMHADPINIRYSEGFATLNADADPRKLDFPFAIAAHEVAHQWWGNQLDPARVAGAPVLSESLAWYSAMNVIERSYGPAHLRRFLDMLREAYLSPRARAGVPLLQADDWFVAYRKGPFAMYALREYLGEKQVTLALRRLFEKHKAGAAPLPTTLDLYAELEAVTPPSLRSLLVDLFKENTYWDLSTRDAHVERIGKTWRVTMNVIARKVFVDINGMETERPMNDLIEIGVYGKGERPLYLSKQRIRSGTQRITVIVDGEPVRAGIDPRNILIDTEWRDNTVDVRGK